MNPEHFLLLIWLQGATRPLNFTVPGKNLADALVRFFACSPEIDQSKITRLEVYQ